MNINIIELELPKIEFSVATLQDKYKNGLLKDHLDAVQYIQQYYHESKNGMYYFYDVETDDFEFKTKDNFTAEVLKKVSNCKVLCKQINENNKIYRIVSDIFKPRYYKIGEKYYINACKGFLHKKYKPYDEYTDEIKENVNLYISFLKEIMCNNDEDMLDAYLKYYAQLARGKKTQVIIYRKSGEGWGKSTETDFIREFVFGKEICLISNTDPIITSNNKILLGKLLVIFEELPTFSKAQWSGVSARLKTFTTETETMYADKYEKSISAENITSFQINTNVESIQNSNGRRYIILDLNPSHMEDFDYFENIRGKCFNMTVGEAFFSYLMTKISDEQVEKFKGQHHFPDTSNKRLTIANLLHSSYKFLKERHLLTNTPVEKIPPSEMFLEYKLFCVSEQYSSCGRNDFYKKLETIGIYSSGSNGKWYYNVDMTTLKNIAKKHKWICEYDEYEGEDDNDNEKEKEEVIDYKALYEALKLENDELQNKNKKLKRKLKKMNIE